MHSSMSGSRSLSAAGKLTVVVWSLRPAGVAIQVALALRTSRSPRTSHLAGVGSLVAMAGLVLSLLAWDAAAPGIGHGVAEGPELLLLDEPTNGAQQFCGRAAQGWQAARYVAGRRRVAGAQLGVRLPVPLPATAARPPAPPLAGRGHVGLAGIFLGLLVRGTSLASAWAWCRRWRSRTWCGASPRCWRRSSCCNASCPAPTRARWRQRSGCRTREHGQHPGHHDHRRWDPARWCSPPIWWPSRWLRRFCSSAATLPEHHDEEENSNECAKIKARVTGGDGGGPSGRCGGDRDPVDVGGRVSDLHAARDTHPARRHHLRDPGPLAVGTGRGSLSGVVRHRGVRNQRRAAPTCWAGTTPAWASAPGFRWPVC